MKKWLFGFLLLGLVGCSGLPRSRPQDFAITVSEDGGMVPYGRSLTLNTTQSEDETFIDGLNLLVQFQTSEADLDTVYEAVVDNRFQRIRTREEEVYDRGGSSIRVVADGENYSVSDSGMSFVRSSWADEFNNVYAAAYQVISAPTNAAAFTLSWDDSLVWGGWEVTLTMGADYLGMSQTNSGTRELTIYTSNAAASYPLIFTNNNSEVTVSFNLDLTQTTQFHLTNEGGQPTVTP